MRTVDEIGYVARLPVDTRVDGSQPPGSWMRALPKGCVVFATEMGRVG